MAARVVCFSSARGGTGKTTIAACAAQTLAAMGKRVLLVDADADGNGLTLLYLHEVLAARRLATEPQAGMFEPVPAGGAGITRCRLQDNLDLVPARYSASPGPARPFLSFVDALKRLTLTAPEVDYVLLDAQAGRSAYARACMEVAHDVVIVTELDPVSITGVLHLQRTFAAILAARRVWIQPNRALPESFAGLERLARAGHTLPAIPIDLDVARAYAARRLAVDLGAPTPFTRAMVRLVQHLGAETWQDGLDHPDERCDAGIADEESELRGITAELAGMRVRREELERALVRRDVLASFSVRLGLSLAIAGLAGAAGILLGFRMHDTGLRAVAYLVVALGLVLAWSVWGVASRRSRRRGDHPEQRLELEAIDERTRELDARAGQLRIYIEALQTPPDPNT